LKATTKAHAALLGTNLFFAINLTAIKFIVNAGFAQPFAINIIRVGVTSILLWGMYIFQSNKTPVNRADIGRLVLCALMGVAINQLLFVKGLSLTYSIHASLLMLITPILIIIIAASFLNEKWTLLKLSGLILGITGACILLSTKEITGNARNAFLGDVLIISNAVAYAIFFVLVKPLMKTYPPITVIRLIFTIGFFMMLPFCWREFNDVPWHSFTPVAWGTLCSIVIAGTFLAYLFNVYGIKMLGASTAGTYIYSQPFFAAAIAAIFLGEQLTTAKIVAAGFIFLGVYLSNKTPTHV
jgi:drug/metabolite transporter (DMT)-like permease